MTQVTVRLYEQGDKVWRDFKAGEVNTFSDSLLSDFL